MPHKTEEELRSKAATFLEAKTRESTCFSSTSEQRLPRFNPTELQLGTFLGEGGFCVVKEVSGINLDPDAENVSCYEEQNILMEDGGKIVQDRTFIASHAIREGCKRYAIKKLSSKLIHRSNGTFVSGVIDLAMEVKYLAVIQHPHIIKMRAIASVHPCSDRFFIVLDRLYETLTDRIESWRKSTKKQRGVSGTFRRLSIGEKGKRLKETMFVERLMVAHDVSSAMDYLHKNRITYRDIKPDNIGFDIRGDVKVFDFGLAKELNEIHRVDGTDVFKLTKRCGSPRYMAPEVFKGSPYNEFCDVYSLGLLIWQICECITPFDKFDYNMLADLVMWGNERPYVNPKWSHQIKHVVTRAWDYDYAKRPDCEEICDALKNEIVNISGDSALEDLDFTSRTEASILGRNCR